MPYVFREERRVHHTRDLDRLAPGSKVEVLINQPNPQKRSAALLWLLEHSPPFRMSERLPVSTVNGNSQERIRGTIHSRPNGVTCTSYVFPFFVTLDPPSSFPLRRAKIEKPVDNKSK